MYRFIRLTEFGKTDLENTYKFLSSELFLTIDRIPGYPGKQILNTMKSHLFGWKPVFRYLLVLFMLLGANLYGATHTVSDQTGLINAITAVNASLEDDTITFTGNIGLEAVLPDINKATGSLTIEGNGYTLSRNSVPSEFRILTINAGVVTIDRLTISGGNAFYGGGIYSSGTLTLTNCTVSGNTAGGDGGGICNEYGMTLTNCTVSGNTSNGSGGGIYNYYSTLNMTNCTVSGNTAGGNGGGIYSQYGTLTLIRNIVSGNSAAIGSEIYREGGSISANAHNVFGNSGLTTAEAFYDFTPGATDVTCTSDAPLIGIHRSTALDSILSPLADNGGPTQTHALVAGGPAIDRDQVSLAGSYPATDQRGVVRPYGLGVDAGAYEYPSFQLMSVSPGHRDFEAAGGIQNVTVTSSVVWTVTYAPDWLTISPISGNGDWSVTLTASANSGLYRTGSITFSANGVTDVYVNVSQASGAVPPPVGPTDPDPEPEPEPILEWSYSHSLVSNTAKLNAWVLDPDARLGVGANWVMEGDLSRGFRFVDGMLVGMFDTTGIHTFRISGTDGIITVNHTFTVRVMAPTVCPTIFGAWINGDHLSIEVLEDARHGVAAQTAPMQMTLEQGQSTDIRFDWDYIKDGFSFRILGGELPPGLILDGDTGVISGVPSASGSYRFLISVKDWRGRGYQWVEVNIP